MRIAQGPKKLTEEQKSFLLQNGSEELSENIKELALRALRKSNHFKLINNKNDEEKYNVFTGSDLRDIASELSQNGIEENNVYNLLGLTKKDIIDYEIKSHLFGTQRDSYKNIEKELKEYNEDNPLHIMLKKRKEKVIQDVKALGATDEDIKKLINKVVY